MDQNQPSVVASDPVPSAQAPAKKGLFSFLNPMNWFGGGKPKEAVPPVLSEAPIAPATPAPAATEQPLTPPTTSTPV
jgi:hypothetical protein